MVFDVVWCPSVCHVGVSKHPNLLSNFFFAWWPHHSSFPNGDPTMKFRRGHPQQGRQIEVGYQKFTISNHAVFQKYRYRYRIPRYFKIPKPNTEPTWKNTDENHLWVQCWRVKPCITLALAVILIADTVDCGDIASVSCTVPPKKLTFGRRFHGFRLANLSEFFVLSPETGGFRVSTFRQRILWISLIFDN